MRSPREVSFAARAKRTLVQLQGKPNGLLLGAHMDRSCPLCLLLCSVSQNAAVHLRAGIDKLEHCRSRFCLSRTETSLRRTFNRRLPVSHHTRNRFRAGLLIDVFPCRQLAPLGHQPLPATLPGKSQVLSPVTLSHQHAPTMRNKKRSIDGTIDKQIGATHHSTIPKHTHAAGSERTVWGARWGTCCNNRPFRLSCCRLLPNLAGAGGLLFAPGAPCCRCC